MADPKGTIGKITKNRPAVVELLNRKDAKIYKAMETSFDKIRKSKDYKLAMWCATIEEAREQAKTMNQRVAFGRPKVSQTPGNPQSGREWPMPKPEKPGSPVKQLAETKKVKAGLTDMGTIVIVRDQNTGEFKAKTKEDESKLIRAWGKTSFTEAQYDEVLRKVSEAGYDLGEEITDPSYGIRSSKIKAHKAPISAKISILLKANDKSKTPQPRRQLLAKLLKMSDGALSTRVLAEGVTPVPPVAETPGVPSKKGSPTAGKSAAKGTSDFDVSLRTALENLVKVAEKLPQPATHDGLSLVDALAQARNALKSADKRPGIKASITRLPSGRWKDSNGNSYHTIEDAADAEAWLRVNDKLDEDSPEAKTEHSAAVEEILSAFNPSDFEPTDKQRRDFGAMLEAKDKIKADGSIRCAECGIPIPDVPEGASYEETLCDTCAKKLEGKLIKAAEAPGMAEVDEARTGVTEEFSVRAQKALAEALKAEVDDVTPEREEEDGSLIFSHGKEEYRVFENQDAVHAAALARVEEDLENEPELFSQDFLSSYMDASDLDKRLYAQDLADSRTEDMSDSDVESEATRYGVEVETDGEIDIDATKEALNSHVYDEIHGEIQRFGLAEYLIQEGLYSSFEEVVKAGVVQLWGDDRRRCAEDAVASDGEGHFLSSYDGETHEISGGMVYVIQ